MAILNNVALEMSLKPFKAVDDSSIDAVCHELFRQWSPLLRDAEQASVLLWTADGSEILDYRGDMSAPIEWARYIGSANPRLEVFGDPERKSIHARSYLYTENPATITYATLKRIVNRLRDIGHAITGLPVRVGATFDPGCEFAKSPWKYERHNETCLANTGGPKSFMCCYATLNADKVSYAAFPQGITQDMPLGTFFGGQCRAFLADLGFDYIWFSNGFGFGLETWMTRGPLFDGQTFYPDLAKPTRDKILDFWRLFRAQCPDTRVETRGTNLSTGIDLASDAVPLRELYQGNFNFLPPPNSPWAALNRDFALELTGYMSHIAELPPGEGFPFRFYTHDPWWKNSPWLDRYAREPHDIYLPLSIGRINAHGQVETPSAVHFLSIDNSFGQMPVQVPNEVIPHIQQARRCAPDAPGPLVWVYPFDELHDTTFGPKPRLSEAFFIDWFIRSAIRNGLPLNTVISTRAFLSTQATHQTLLRESVLVMPVPDAGSPVESAMLAFVDAGGRVLLYGPTTHASQTLLDRLALRHDTPLTGPMEVRILHEVDQLTDVPHPSSIIHRPQLSGGGCAETFTGDAAHLIAQVHQGDATRAAAATTSPLSNGGKIAWVRGGVAADYKDTDLISGRGHLPTADDPMALFQPDLLMRNALGALGVQVCFAKKSPAQPNPITCIHRHGNGFYFSGYVPDTTVELQLKTPMGAPILFGCDAEMRDGFACYRMPRAWQHECRIFIEQPSGVVTCTEMTAEQIGISRRFKLTGLSKAVVRFYPSTFDAPVSMVNNGSYPYFVGPHASFIRQSDAMGDYLRTEPIDGELVISH